MTTPPMLVVDPDDHTPPYEQLRRQLADLIHLRVLGPGARLPPLRQLAGDLGLAVGTVARTYRELESAGLVHPRRGGGTRVVEALPVRTEAERLRDLDGHASAYARAARLLGVGPEAALDAVRRAVTGGAP